MELIKKVTTITAIPNLLTSFRALTNLFKRLCFHDLLQFHRMEMLEGLVRRIELDFVIVSIAKASKSSKDANIVEVGADIELVAKEI
ncbi:Hypothetical predicted protein [Olea europaea subsp. europaea]|uniref:Uncharacterized protein n=1 Tax=Olea europaea subsp. europaea TaxID=158383 RepID=A0A8S0PCV9_OLEEU|nr:Hypothetical predicted protein [Olea europaea subsp. europaea]